MSAAVFDIADLGEPPAEVVGAFVKSVNDLDASRRVAWAKMYAALQRGEEAERQLAIAREDNLLLSRFAGFSYGAILALGVGDIYRDYLSGDLSAIASYLPKGSINAGTSTGNSWLTRFPEAIREVREYVALTLERKEAERDWLEHCRNVDGDFPDFVQRIEKRIERRLAKLFGFNRSGEMYNYLWQYKAANE